MVTHYYKSPWVVIKSRGDASLSGWKTLTQSRLCPTLMVGHNLTWLGGLARKRQSSQGKKGLAMTQSFPLTSGNTHTKLDSLSRGFCKVQSTGEFPPLYRLAGSLRVAIINRGQLCQIPQLRSRIPGVNQGGTASWRVPVLWWWRWYNHCWHTPLYDVIFQ